MHGLVGTVFLLVAVDRSVFWLLVLPFGLLCGQSHVDPYRHPGVP
jgi:hypothetical protein